MARRRAGEILRAPFLRRLALAGPAHPGRFPFTLPFLADSRFSLELEQAVTFFVGENGTGKSTLLEAIALASGFGVMGGSRDHTATFGSGDADDASLAGALRLSWRPKVTNGFFFRAESFFNIADYIDQQSPGRYGVRDLQAMSHGEAFLAFIKARFGDQTRSIYLMDEPEAALSPARQLAFLLLLDQGRRSGNVQYVIATHSPILMAYPEAELLLFSDQGIAPADYRDTPHFAICRRFFADPERYVRRLLAEGGGPRDALDEDQSRAL